jgi:hypothetical protein
MLRTLIKDRSATLKTLILLPITGLFALLENWEIVTALLLIWAWMAWYVNRSAKE